jgi:hypothetical protein
LYRERLTRDFVSLNPASDLDLAEPARKGRTIVGFDGEVLLHEPKQAVAPGLGLVAERLVQLVRQQVLEYRCVTDTDFEFHHDGVRLDEDLGDCGSQHRPRDDQRIGPQQGRTQRYSDGSAAQGEGFPD